MTLAGLPEGLDVKGNQEFHQGELLKPLGGCDAVQWMKYLPGESVGSSEFSSVEAAWALL